MASTPLPLTHPDFLQPGEMLRLPLVPPWGFAALEEGFFGLSLGGCCQHFDRVWGGCWYCVVLGPSCALLLHVSFL